MRIEELYAQIEAQNPEVVAAVAHEVDPPAILALNVIRLRAARGLTQVELAQMLGVAQPRIAEIERGDANPRLDTISRLAHALGVSVPELFVDNLHAPPAVGDAASATVAEEEPRRRRAM